MKPFGWVGLFAAILLGSLGGMAPTRCVAQNQIDLPQFDSWIFQRHGRDEARCRTGLKKEIELQFVRIEQSTPLTESQKDALRLAGQGDIKRFFDRVNDAREKFLQMEQKNGNQDINEAYQLASPLQQELTQGLFGNGSLIQKVTRYVMTEDQASELEELEIKQYRAKLEGSSKVFLATLGRGAALTAKQQRQLHELFQKKIQQIQELPTGNNQVALQHYLLSIWIGEITEKEAERILDPEQIQIVERLAERAKGVRQMLLQQGLIQ
ncbi:hypothetical protein [Rhodopirellula sp. P2]|uniref:hypothetical protein n=1 Tax=Rhodopirellula sp. P2 TaxID=2127060 RepID=UPI002367A788|nr:hypothetical protein [Rhodopirellula sp. P2]WDQ18041.1 hypothetical protein PSR62_05670 [Rhodopirellula sp. P2]